MLFLANAPLILLYRLAFLHKYCALALKEFLSNNLDTIRHSQVCHLIQDRALEHQFFELIINLARLQPIAKDRPIGDRFGTDLNLEASPLFERGVILAPVADSVRGFLFHGRKSILRHCIRNASF